MNEATVQLYFKPMSKWVGN